MHNQIRDDLEINEIFTHFQERIKENETMHARK